MTNQQMDIKNKSKIKSNQTKLNHEHLQDSVASYEGLCTGNAKRFFKVTTTHAENLGNGILGAFKGECGRGSGERGAYSSSSSSPYSEMRRSHSGLILVVSQPNRTSFSRFHSYAFAHPGPTSRLVEFQQETMGGEAQVSFRSATPYSSQFSGTGSSESRSSAKFPSQSSSSAWTQTSNRVFSRQQLVPMRVAQ